MDNMDRYVVICGAKMHWNTWGNHDGTTDAEPYPKCTDLIFYSRYDKNNYTTDSACIDTNFKLVHGNVLLDNEIMFTKKQLKGLYAWLENKPYSKLLVKSAKDNTIKLSKAQIQNIKFG